MWLNTAKLNLWLMASIIYQANIDKKRKKCLKPI